MALSRREVAIYAAKQLVGGASSKEVAKSLAAYLVDTKSVRSAELLLNEVKRVLSDEYGHASVDIISAHSLGASLEKQIKDLVGAHKTLEIQEEIEPDILGGVIVRTPSKEFDGSVKTSINKLKTVVR